MQALFTMEGDGYVPNKLARTGWTGPVAAHGSAAAALLAHGIESERGDPEMVVTRMTIDLFRTIPHGPPMKVVTNVLRGGHRIKVVDASIVVEGTVVARASGVLLRRTPDAQGSTVTPPRPPLPSWEGLKETIFPTPPTSFRNSLEFRYITLDEPYTGVPLATWVRIPFDFLPGKPLTPFQRAAMQSDYTSAVGQGSRDGDIRFINVDITLYLHREPEGEWLCIESVGHGDDAGVAATSVNLHDSRGLVGHSIVAALANTSRAMRSE